MTLPRIPRAPWFRLIAVTAAATAAAMMSLASVAAHAAPTTSAHSTTPATTASTTTSPTTSPTTTSSTTASTTTGSATTSPTTTSSTAASTTTGSATTTTASTTGSSTPVAVPGPRCPGRPAALTPVLCLPAGSGEDQPAAVGTDGSLEFLSQIVNGGPAVADATIVITIPTGLRLATDDVDDPVTRYEEWWTTDDDEGTALDCAPNADRSVLTCTTGAIAVGDNFLVALDLEAQDDVVAGTTEILGVTLQSTPDPGVFPSTSVQATIDFVGTAHLQVKLSPDRATVPVGQSLTVVATVHNAGPNRAVEAAAVGLVFPDDLGDDYTFLITNSAPFPTIGSQSGFAMRSLTSNRSSAETSSAGTSSSRTSSSSSTAVAPSPVGFWPIGTIDAGATATVTIVVKAIKVGHVNLEFDASSADESCDGGDPSCENDALAALTAVDATPTTTAAPTTAPTTTVAATSAAASVSSVSSSTIGVAGSSTSSATALPNTGFDTSPWLGSGAAAILLGAVLTALGLPRRRVRARHR